MRYPILTWRLRLDRLRSIDRGCFGVLSAVGFQAFMGMLALVAATMAAGWLLGASGSENRIAMTFTTSVRNVAVALEIATSSSPRSARCDAVRVYGLSQTLLMAAIALVCGRLEATGSAANEVTSLQNQG